MDLDEAWQQTLDSLRAHRLRWFLTLLGIVFGVGAVIAMLSIGAGAEQQALRLIDTLGLRNVIVEAREYTRQDELQQVRKLSQGVSLRDAEALRAGVPGIEELALELAIEPYKVLSPQGRAKPRVLGVSASFGRLMTLSLAEGRFFDTEDERRFAQVCVLGAGVRRALFGVSPALGGPVKVNDQWLEVIGVLAPSHPLRGEIQGLTVAGTANDVYLPVTTAERKFARAALRSPIDKIVLAAAPEASVRDVAALGATLLTRLHGGADDYRLVVPEALLEQSRRTRRLFDLVMGAIASIALLVGGIGIVNVMLATVLERTREIGIRRALGARRVDIRNQFLFEAFVVSALGGLAGIALGVFIARGVALAAGWPTLVTPAAVLVATGVSLAVGLLSGLYPALRAARLDPIDALRYE